MSCEFNVAQILEATGGKALSIVEKGFVGVGTDTRVRLDNKIFIALKGDQFDAHDYLTQAVDMGAKCLIVHSENNITDHLRSKVTVIKVDNTLRALQQMAKYWRKRIKAKVFGITGSNGKTSTKEFAAAILSAQFKVHFSQGSFNNHWGVPLTLLETSKFHEVVLVEMGMNHSGELTQLSKIAEPDVVVCTTVGRAHIGHFNGSLQAIADAKEEIYLSNPKAVKIFNYDNDYTLKMYERISKLLGAENTVAFSSFSAGSEVSLRATHLNFDGIKIIGHISGVKGESLVPVFGRHNVVNLMAAASIAVVMKMEPELIWASMSRCQSKWGRGQYVRLENGCSVIFDAYNANPDSMAGLIKTIFEINMPEGGRKMAVLGEMFELGENTEKFHYDLGELVGNTDIETIWFLGPSHKAFEAGVKSTGNQKNLILSNNYEEPLALNLKAMLNPLDVVIMKGSRGMKLERVMQAWDSHFANKN
jgi:UDP-N-acetylmuramoyl-tripeptide--D-alanyl-D-alanine ligase